VATRREEKERRRAERLAAERREAAAERRRLMLGYVVAGVLTLAVLVGLVLVLMGGDDEGSGQIGGEDVPEEAHVQPQSGFIHDVPFDDREGTPPPPLQQGDLQEAARAANCDLRLDLPLEGRTHVDDPNVQYDTNPPTSGDHFEEQQADGAYSEMPRLVDVVHSLEHGRIEIQYSPDLPEEDQLALKGVFDEDPDGMLFFPNPEMPYDVAATAWTQMIGCDSFEGQATLDAIRNFRDVYRGQAPEPVQIGF
jgi:Protein of unknown function (DUF3105)